MKNIKRRKSLLHKVLGQKALVPTVLLVWAISDFNAALVAAPIEAPPTQAANVEVDLSVRKYIGTVSELQREKFFNLHGIAGSQGLAEMDMLYIRNELNAGYGRYFYGPSTASSTTDYPSTEQAVIDGALNIENAKKNPLYRFSSNRNVVTEHPRTVLKPGNDPIDGARWAADYFTYYFDDALRPLFYEPMNEPFVHAQDFVEGPWNPEENARVRDHMTQWFAEIGREFDERGLSTNVIGYSSAWPSFELWDFGHWDVFQKKFMDDAGEYMDAFSFHLYDGVNVTGQANFRSGSNTEAIMDLIETYSYMKWGKVVPHAVTEYGGIIRNFPVQYSDEKSSQELRAYNHILFSLLAREDRLMTSIPFITTTSPWFYRNNNFEPYSADILRPDPSKIFSGKVNGLLATQKVKFYKLWADVKGHRVKINSDDPDLAARAFVYGNKAYIALNNYEDDEKVVQLGVLVPDQQTLSSLKIKRLNVPFNEVAQYTDQVVLAAPSQEAAPPQEAASLQEAAPSQENVPSQIVMAGHETVVLEYTYTNAIVQNKIIQQNNYYADAYLQAIVADQALSFTFNDVKLDQHVLSFADVFAETFTYRQASVDEIKPASIKRYQSIVRSFERSLEVIRTKHPLNWRERVEFEKLLKRANRSSAAKAAFSYHYSIYGYNDTQGSAHIRFAIGRKHDKSKTPQLFVNGHPVDIPNDWLGYDQVDRQDFFGAIDVPFPAKYLKASNTIRFVFPDTQGHVSSVVLQAETNELIPPIAVDSIDLIDKQLSIVKDRPYRLNANIFPENATNKYLLWRSSQPDVATIDGNGVLTPVSPGITTVSATSADGGFESSVDVTVEDRITVRNTVVVTNDVSVFKKPISSFNATLSYSTDIDRDLALELFSPSNKWLGIVRKTIPAGEGVMDLTLKFKEELPPGKGYRAIAALRAVGGDWRTTVDAQVIRGIEIKSGQPPLPEDEGNLLGTNGGFELGSLGNWKIVFGSLGRVNVINEAAKEGDYGIEFDTADGGVGILIDEDVFPTGLMTLGKKFRLSFYLKRVSEGPWSGGMTQFVNLDGGFKTSGQQWFGGTLSNQWFLVEKEFEGLDWPATRTFIEINLRTPGHKWHADSFRLEDISVVNVNEPSE